MYRCLFSAHPWCWFSSCTLKIFSTKFSTEWSRLIKKLCIFSCPLTWCRTINLCIRAILEGSLSVNTQEIISSIQSIMNRGLDSHIYSLDHYFKFQPLIHCQQTWASWPCLEPDNEITIVQIGWTLPFCEIHTNVAPQQLIQSPLFSWGSLINLVDQIPGSMGVKICNPSFFNCLMSKL